MQVIRRGSNAPTEAVAVVQRTRKPKQLLYGELTYCALKPGGQKKRYKDQFQVTLKAYAMPRNNLETGD